MVTQQFFLTFCVMFIGSKLEGDLFIWVHIPHLSGPFVSSLSLSSHLPAAKEDISQSWGPCCKCNLRFFKSY